MLPMPLPITAPVIFQKSPTTRQVYPPTSMPRKMRSFTRASVAGCALPAKGRLVPGGGAWFLAGMKRLLVLFLILLAPVHAAEWRNDAFGCVVNLPESEGWEAIPTPVVPGITVLVAMQNLKRQANFVVNVIDKTPSTDLADPKLHQLLAGILRAFSYDFPGFSKVQIGGITWLQYPVTSKADGIITKGVLRFGSGNGRIFCVNLMLHGGKEPSQDLELQAIAATFRFVEPAGAKPATIAAVPPAAGPGKPSSTTAASPATPPAETEDAAFGVIPISYVRYGTIGAAVLLVLLLLKKIISAGKTVRRM